MLPSPANMPVSASLTGKVPEPGAFAPPFQFPSKEQQKLLINAGEYGQSRKTDLVMARNPTPFLQDAMNGFSKPAIQPGATVLSMAKPKVLGLPQIGALEMLQTPQKGLRDVAQLQKGLESIQTVTAANRALKRGNVDTAEYVLKHPVTVEQIANKTLTPEIRLTAQGQKVAINPGSERTDVGPSTGVVAPPPNLVPEPPPRAPSPDLPRFEPAWGDDDDDDDDDDDNGDGGDLFSAQQHSVAAERERLERQSGVGRSNRAKEECLGC